MSKGDITEDQFNDSAPGIQMSEQLAASLGVLRRRWLVIVLVPALAIIVSLGVSLSTAKSYTATAKVTVSPLNSVTDTLNPGSEVNSADPERDLNTAVSAITETPMANLVRARLRTPESSGALLEQVNAELEGTTNIVDIAAADPDPARAASIANTFASEYVKYSLNAERQPFQQAVVNARAELNSLTPAQQAAPTGLSDQADLQKLQQSLAVMTSNVSVSQAATPPPSPTSPKPSKDAAIALIVGLLIGLVAAITLELFDRSVRDEDDASALSRVRSLGVIPRPHLHTAGQARGNSRWLQLWPPRALTRTRTGATPAPQPLTTTSTELGSRDWELAESYGSLAVNLIALRLGAEEKVVMVTSPGPQDGKTSVSLGLAAALADLGQRVVVVECDLRRPRFADYLGLPQNGPGLSSILEGEASSEEAIVEVSTGTSSATPRVGSRNGSAGPRAGRSFGVLACGPVPTRPLALLGSAEMPPLLRRLQNNSDFVLIDTPPLGALKDAVVLAGSVDHVVLVARIGHTSRDGLRRCRTAVEQLGSPLLGIVTVGGPRGGALNYYFKATRTAATANPRARAATRARARAATNGSGQADGAAEAEHATDANGSEPAANGAAQADLPAEAAILAATAIAEEAAAAESGSDGETATYLSRRRSSASKGDGEAAPARARKTPSRRDGRGRTP